MLSIELPMKNIIFFIAFFVSACNASEKVKVESFSNDIKQLIAFEKREEFRMLPVFPNMEVSNDALSLIFEVGNGYVDFFAGRNISIKIYGPYMRSDAEGYSSYSIVYYHPKKIKTDTKGHFKSTEIQKYWGTGYLETIVTIVDGRVMFHRTPFYYGSHAPWAEDY